MTAFALVALLLFVSFPVLGMAHRKRDKIILIRATRPGYPGAYGLTRQGEDHGYRQGDRVGDAARRPGS